MSGTLTSFIGWWVAVQLSPIFSRIPDPGPETFRNLTVLVVQNLTLTIHDLQLFTLSTYLLFFFVLCPVSLLLYVRLCEILAFGQQLDLNWMKALDYNLRYIEKKRIEIREEEECRWINRASFAFVCICFIFRCLYFHLIFLSMWFDLVWFQHHVEKVLWERSLLLDMLLLPKKTSLTIPSLSPPSLSPSLVHTTQRQR